MTTRSRIHRPHPSHRGFTLVEVIAVVVVIGVAVALAIGAAQPRTLMEMNIAKCANNMRLLAIANHVYADLHKEKFFYDWGREKKLDGTDHGPPKRWWDQDRIGIYLKGSSLTWWPASQGQPWRDGQSFPPDWKQPPAKERFKNDAGIGALGIQCPADIGGRVRDAVGRTSLSNDIVGVRSYHQNFWASGIDFPKDQTTLDDDLQRRGEFFDRVTAEAPDKLILFGESVSAARVIMKDPNGKLAAASSGEFGSSLRPGQRFSGILGFTVPPKGFGSWDRWARTSPMAEIDLARHSPESMPLNKGAANIAYVDGHISLRSHTNLYESETNRSTYQTLWSSIDHHIDVER